MNVVEPTVGDLSLSVFKFRSVLNLKYIKSTETPLLPV